MGAHLLTFEKNAMRILVLSILFLLPLLGCHGKWEYTSNIPGKNPVGWEYADSLKKKIQSAEIPTDTFSLDEFTFRSDPSMIQKAIDHTHQQGGGTLLIPAGQYLTGPLKLKSRVDLHLEEGAELQFIPDPELYPLVYNWFSGIPCMNYSPMIYARNETDISISGKGIINGQGFEPVWKNMKFKEKMDWELLRELEREGVDPVNRRFGNGHFLRPDLLAFVACARVNISGITMINAPYWSIHPVMCHDVTIENSFINSQGYDQIGIALESSSNVLINGMHFQSVGDGIKILSGRVEIPGNRPSQNILIRNSTFKNVGYSPVIISSNTQAGANSIFMSGLKIDSTEMMFRVYGGRRGAIHDLLLKDCQADRISESVLYSKISRAEKGPAIISNIHLDGIEVKHCARSFVLSGHRKNAIEHVTIHNSNFASAKGSYVKNLTNLTFSNFNENGNILAGTYSAGENEPPSLELEGNEEEVLDSDDIQIDEVPELVKQTLEKTFPKTLITDIDRIITSTNVIYDINLEPETHLGIELLVQLDGKILRTKTDIAFSALPDLVLSSLKDHLKTVPDPFMMNGIKKVTYQDLNYFELKGESGQKLFAISITEKGERIEEKQKLITSYFSPDNHKTK